MRRVQLCQGSDSEVNTPLTDQTGTTSSGVTRPFASFDLISTRDLGRRGVLGVRVFRSYQVNTDLMAEAVPHAVFMHCPPARRGQQVTDADPEQSVFDQAENRLCVQKAILYLLLGGGRGYLPTRSAHV